MDNSILKQFGTPDARQDYKIGSVTEVKTNDIYVIETSNGLKMTIQDNSLTLEVGDPVLLAVTEGQTNNSFIIKKGSKSEPIAKNFIIGNGIN